MRMHDYVKPYFVISTKGFINQAPFVVAEFCKCQTVAQRHCVLGSIPMSNSYDKQTNVEDKKMLVGHCDMSYK